MQHDLLLKNKRAHLCLLHRGLHDRITRHNLTDTRGCVHHGEVVAEERATVTAAAAAAAAIGELVAAVYDAFKKRVVFLRLKTKQK